MNRFEITLHNDGTIRGIGGVRVIGADCATSVPGLFVAGDNASREKVAGAISGGGNVNSAWALSSGVFAGTAAAQLARRATIPSTRLRPLGQAGLRPRGQPKAVDLAAIHSAARAEMHPYDKNLFRNGPALAASGRVLDALWNELADHAADNIALREAAALVATARWSIASAIRRTESRGMHRREDFPAQDTNLSVRLLSGGFDHVRVAADSASDATGFNRELETVS
jgi:succinate dehydrogenase/fumarate reductase flavoprotein subunit